jgi:hypothetical protein
MTLKAACLRLADPIRRQFWRGAAAAAGLAVAHRSRLRWIPVGVLGIAAFLAGQAVGRLLLGPG